MYKADGSLFVGNFVNGKAQGQGIFISSSGAYYYGQLIDNQARDKGKFVNGSFSYEGQFEDNLFHGNGSEMSDKHFFNGTYEKGVKKYGDLRWWELLNQEK